MSTHYDATTEYRRARTRAARVHHAIGLLDSINEALAGEYNDTVLESLLDKLEEHLHEKLHLVDHSVSLHALNLMAEAS